MDIYFVIFYIKYYLNKENNVLCYELLEIFANAKKVINLVDIYSHFF